MAVTLTLESVAFLGLIVVIRTFLSFSLEVELQGRWPWRAARRPTDRAGRRAARTCPLRRQAASPNRSSSARWQFTHSRAQGTMSRRSKPIGEPHSAHTPNRSGSL